MTTVLLVRHGRTTANTAGVLAGWSPDVHLDEAGEKQAARLKERWGSLKLDARISSPLDRCVETAEQSRGAKHPDLVLDDRLGECRYGDWTGKKLSTLSKDALWKIVQNHPSAARFPGDHGESLLEVQQRAVSAVREWNATVGKNGVYAIFSHGDVIKAVLADALGMHLDQFQRLIVDPASVSIVTYTPTRPFIHRINDTVGDLSGLRPPRRKRTAPSSDAAVGGGSGEHS